MCVCVCDIERTVASILVVDSPIVVVVADVVDDDVLTRVATPDVVATASDAIRDVLAPKPLTQQLSLPL